MGTGDYAHLRSRYGNHLTEGIAGETILVDAPKGLAGLDNGAWGYRAVSSGTGLIGLMDRVRIGR